MLIARDLLAGVSGAKVLRGDPARQVRELRDDSRQVGAGDLFVAVPGTKSDGRSFVADALAKGAAGIVLEGEPGDADVLWISVPSARHALGVMAANRFPAARSMSLTGITGTNGKTTITYLLEAILKAAGRQPGVIGTVTYRYAGREVAAPLTTPGALALHALFGDMLAAGCTDAVMEVSSIALDQGRVAGCRYRVAGLSNVTQDHLDYHGTMDQYFAAKAVLFRELLTPHGVGVVFADREDGRRMRAQVRGRVLAVSLEDRSDADVAVLSRTLDEAGARATVRTPVGPLELSSPLVGDYNLANLTLAIGMAVAQEIPARAIVEGLADQKGAPGRLERVPNDRGVLCVVDYAHTPDALERAMAALRPLTRGRLVVVFGCGGDRDPTKRPLMGLAGARDADLAVITSDNPRTEDPARIVAMVVEGARRAGVAELGVDALAGGRGYHVEVDRRTAIRRAVAACGAGDTLLIAGKGHEDYQIVGTTKLHFDDREEAAAAFGGQA